VRYELGFYIPEDSILHSHRRENLDHFSRTIALGFTQPLPEMKKDNKLRGSP
jgi:hypothetical protein